jgi:hypothetical protein
MQHNFLKGRIIKPFPGSLEQLMDTGGYTKMRTGLCIMVIEHLNVVL